MNAFAAGLTPADAAITVTRGALDRLTRAELQGVIAHEVSHVLNGDMRLNQRLMGLSFGILALSLTGRWLLRSVRLQRRSRSGSAGMIILAIGVMLAAMDASRDQEGQAWEDLVNIDGIGETAARAVVRFFADSNSRSVVDALLKEVETIPAEQVAASSPVSGTNGICPDT